MQENSAQPDYKSKRKAQERRFNRIIPITSDELTIVLKGHLLIEEELRAITRALVANPEYFDRARLNFSASLQLARACIGHLHKEQCVWVASEKLNSIRNKLAHQAEPDPNPELFKHFFEICENGSISKEWEKVSSLPRGKEKLYTYILFIWSTFRTLVEVMDTCIEVAPNPLLKLKE